MRPVLLLFAQDAGFGHSAPAADAVPGALFPSVSCAYPSGRLILETFREPEGSSSRFIVHHTISVDIMVLAS
jgi:prolipoprotein diacylglyceryltransferase